MITVKALIWSHRNDNPAYEVCADCPFGRYAISPAGELGYGWKQPRQNVWSGFLPTCDEAKAAAQADYETRILSALTSTPEPTCSHEFRDPTGTGMNSFCHKCGEPEPSALTNTSGDDEAPVAKVVSKWGDPEAFGERDLVALVDLSTLKYNTPLFARQQSAAVRDDGELRKRVMRAIFDPGQTEGYKGDRDLTTWQADAVMRALHSTQEG